MLTASVNLNLVIVAAVKHYKLNVVIAHASKLQLL